MVNARYNLLLWHNMCFALVLIDDKQQMFFIDDKHQMFFIFSVIDSIFITHSSLVYEYQMVHSFVTYLISAHVILDDEHKMFFILSVIDSISAKLSSLDDDYYMVYNFITIKYVLLMSSRQKVVDVIFFLLFLYILSSLFLYFLFSVFFP